MFGVWGRKDYCLDGVKDGSMHWQWEAQRLRNREEQVRPVIVLDGRAKQTVPKIVEDAETNIMVDPAALPSIPLIDSFLGWLIRTSAVASQKQSVLEAFTATLELDAPRSSDLDAPPCFVRLGFSYSIAHASSYVRRNRILTQSSQRRRRQHFARIQNAHRIPHLLHGAHGRHHGLVVDHAQIAVLGLSQAVFGRNGSAPPVHRLVHVRLESLQEGRVRFEKCPTVVTLKCRLPSSQWPQLGFTAVTLPLSAGFIKSWIRSRISPIKSSNCDGSGSDRSYLYV